MNLGQSVLHCLIRPEAGKGDGTAFIGGQTAVRQIRTGAAAHCQFLALEYRLPGVPVQILQQEGAAKQGISVGIFFGDGDGAGTAVILGGDLNLGVGFLHGPNAGVVLTEEVPLGGLDLLPHIGDAKHQIFKGYDAVLSGGQCVFRTVGTSEGKNRPGQRSIVRTIHFENGQLSRPDVVVEDEIMAGVVLPDRLPIFGDGHRIDCFVPVVSSPAGASAGCSRSHRTGF